MCAACGMREPTHSLASLPLHHWHIAGGVEYLRLRADSTLTRYRTLYRIEKESNPRWYHLDADIRLPQHFGIDPEMASPWKAEINEYYKYAFHHENQRHHWNAVMLAGLAEMDPSTPVSAYTAPEQRDRHWWLGLKRRLNGNDQRYSRAFVAPQPIDGPPAPVLQRLDGPGRHGLGRSGADRGRSHRMGGRAHDASSLYPPSRHVHASRRQ